MYKQVANKQLTVEMYFNVTINNISSKFQRHSGQECTFQLSEAYGKAFKEQTVRKRVSRCGVDKSSNEDLPRSERPALVPEPYLVLAILKRG